MKRDQVKDVLERVMTWSPEDQERVVRFVQQLEQGSSADDITDEEWRFIEERAALREIASDEDVKAVFDKYRGA
jgi:hypothetical protein